MIELRESCFIDGQLIYSRDLPGGSQAPSELGRRPSSAYYCETCGEVWARFIRSDSAGWAFLPSICPRCPPKHWCRRGSIIRDIDLGDTDIPAALLRWEILQIKDLR